MAGKACADGHPGVSSCLTHPPLGFLWVDLFQVFQRQDLFRMSDR